MKIKYLEADCGAGKTYFALSHIASNPGRYVFAVNKIDLIQERIEEFQQFPGAEKYLIAKLHSQCPAPIPVGAQIQTFANTIPQREKSVLLFVTHEGLQVADWKNYEGWSLIIDEVPAVWGYIDKNFTQSAEFVRQFFDAKHYELIPGHLRLTLNSSGQSLRNRWSGDDVVQVMRPILNVCERRSVVLINKDAWNNMKIRKFKVFSLFEPNHLSVFDDVTILGNRFTDSLLHQCWSKIGVKFAPMTGVTLREPVIPIGNRLEVIYFSDRAASFNFFKKEAPLKPIFEWCSKVLGKEDLYYTTNSAFLSSFLFHGQERISVMAHGHNKLKGKTIGIFMAAMKGNPHEYVTIKDVFGITNEEFDLAREYEALYQFVMRSNLRVHDSTEKVYMYVFSKAQAEFLKNTTGCSIRKLDVGVNDNDNKGGRPRKLTLKKAA